MELIVCASHGDEAGIVSGVCLSAETLKKNNLPEIDVW